MPQVRRLCNRNLAPHTLALVQDLISPRPVARELLRLLTIAEAVPVQIVLRFMNQMGVASCIAVLSD